jgi:hypothetical protein
VSTFGKCFVGLKKKKIFMHESIAGRNDKLGLSRLKFINRLQRCVVNLLEICMNKKRKKQMNEVFNV